MLNYIFVPVEGKIELKEFDPSTTEMFDIADQLVGGMHTDFTCFDQPPFVVITDDGDVTDMKENVRLNRFTSRGKFFGDCIIIKASPDYKSRSDYSGMAYIDKEEADGVVALLEGKQ